MPASDAGAAAPYDGPSDAPAAEPERRRSDRRRGQLAIFADRRLADRRRAARRFVDRVRAFFGLPPLS